jgi:hypothetical protein
MLWYKGWLETRVRLLLGVAWMVLLLASVRLAIRTTPGRPGNAPQAVAALSATFAIAIYSVLAGAGIHSQGGFRAAKGLDGSTLFTLSLPVSRLRLLSIRASLGWIEMAVMTAVFCAAAWFLLPIGDAITPLQLAEHAGTLVTCLSALYFLAVLLGTFLNDQGRLFGSWFTLGGLWLLSVNVHLPASVDILRAIDTGSPLVANSIPWNTVAFSMGASVVLFAVALYIARRREY